MAQYKVTGHYVQEGVFGEVEGTFNIHEVGVVKGSIVDKLSQSPSRKVKGFLLRKDEETCLDFVCEVSDNNLLSVRYFLKKDTPSFEGAYSGVWVPVGKWLEFQVVGSYEAPNGETYYYGNFQKLIPHQKDLKQQEAEIILEKMD